MCPDHYPMKCTLSPADKAYLMSKEKYKAFFIFQYKNQDKWLEPSIEKFFSERTWKLFNAGKEGGTGTKYCNVCRYALASDFGIVSLTPLNYNVFQEIGLMQGLQKPLLYLLNPEKKKKIPKEKLPFDIDDQIYVEHTDSQSLEKGLNNKMSLLIDKVILLSGFESAQKKLVQEKINNLSPDAKALLKRIVLEGHVQIETDSMVGWVKQELRLKPECVGELRTQRFIVQDRLPTGSRLMYKLDILNEPYRKYLEELIWQ